MGELGLHINILGMRAASIALQEVSPLVGTVMLAVTDKVAAQTYIFNQGETSSRFLLQNTASLFKLVV